MVLNRALTRKLNETTPMQSLRNGKKSLQREMEYLKTMFRLCHKKSCLCLDLKICSCDTILLELKIKTRSNLSQQK